MAQMMMVYRRGNPARAIAQQDHGAAMHHFPAHIARATDGHSTKVGARHSDAYLAESRCGEPVEVQGDLDQLGAECDAERIGALIANGDAVTARI